MTENRATSVADYTQFSVTAPLDPRLPDGGGYVVNGLFDVVPEKSAITDNYRTYAPNSGTVYQVYNGVELNVSARLRSGLQVQGGRNTGHAGERLVRGPGRAAGPDRRIPHRRRLPAYSPVDPCCDNAARDRQSDDRARLVHRSEDRRVAQRHVPEQPRHPAPGRLHREQLPSSRSRSGRPLSGNATNVTVNLLSPDQARGERVNQLDFRVGKVLRFGRQRAILSADLFNALNKDTILNYNQAYNPTGAWLVPTTVLTARTTKITLQWDFLGKFKVQSSKFKVQSSKFKVQSSKFKVQSSKFKASSK